ncbi:hypothetical protein GCK32_021911 [Trichostrongylus colubriformis]|uniref:Uncharacterized protein n=1 Tax=Trichostrongylus colubriformis TaxID=6319 RepID=A0AAN8FZR7_TRICO
MGDGAGLDDRDAARDASGPRAWPAQSSHDAATARIATVFKEYMEKPPPIVEGHNLQTLHPADQQWVSSHQHSPPQPVQVRD